MLVNYLQHYLHTLKASDKKYLLEVVQSVEKQLPSIYHEIYKTTVKNIVYILVLGILTKDETTSQINILLSQKDIPVNIWARYMATAIWFSGLIRALQKNDQKLKNKILNMLTKFNQDADSLKSTFVVKESTLFVSESLIKTKLLQLKTTLKSISISVLKSIGMFMFSALEIYNNVFSLATLPVRKFLTYVPGGDLLLQFGLHKFILCNLSPISSIIINIHTLITSSLARQGITIGKQLISGTFWQTLDNALNDLTKDLNIESLENEINKYST